MSTRSMLEEVMIVEKPEIVEILGYPHLRTVAAASRVRHFLDTCDKPGQYFTDKEKYLEQFSPMEAMMIERWYEILSTNYIRHEVLNGKLYFYID